MYLQALSNEEVIFWKKGGAAAACRIHSKEIFLEMMGHARFCSCMVGQIASNCPKFFVWDICDDS